MRVGRIASAVAPGQPARLDPALAGIGASSAGTYLFESAPPKMSSIVTSARARRGSSRGLIVAAIVTLASPLLLYLIVRTTIVGLSSAAAVSLPPIDYTPALAGLLPAIADPRVKVPDQAVAMAKQAIGANPIGYEPFFVFGKKAADEGDLKRGTILLEEARRRRPNFLLTRLLLMSYYGSANRYPEALREMDYNLRSSEGVRQVVLPELVKTMRTAAGRRAVADVLAQRPAWREEFVTIAQRQSGLKPEQARDLLDRLRTLKPSADWSLERSLYVQSLVNAGQVAEARSMWLETIPEAERRRAQYIFDGDFKGRAAPRPFGWLLRDGEVGRAEIARSGGPDDYLEVTYFGGRSAELAEQMLALAPGAYQLSFQAKSEAGVKSGDLYWSITCAPGGTELARIRIAEPQPTYRGYQAQVRVPASGCSGQRLRLIAEAGDVVSGFDVQIAKMQVVRQ